MSRDPQVSHNGRPEEIDQIVAAGDAVEEGARPNVMLTRLVRGVEEHVHVEGETQRPSSARCTASLSPRSTRAPIGRAVQSNSRTVAASVSRNAAARSSDTN